MNEDDEDEEFSFLCIFQHTKNCKRLKGSFLQAVSAAVFGVFRGEAPHKQGTAAGFHQEEQLPGL